MSYRVFTNANGETVYKVQVSAGRGRKITKTWRPIDGWSKKTIERELHKFEAQLQTGLANGKILTRKERQEQKRQEKLEETKIKTLRQYVDEVYMSAKEISFSENARVNYRQFLDKHIIPVLGDFPLRDITTAMIAKLLLDFQKQGYAYATVIKLYSILNGLFKAAFMDDSILTNPMLKVTRPKPCKDEPIKDETDKAYTIDELLYILSCLENEPLQWQTYVWLLIDTGIRRGEACGLQWSDIDFKKAQITIRHNLQYTPSAGVYLSTPKNKKVRVVDIGPNALSLLRRHRTDQAQKSISPYVFTQKNSPEPMHPQTPTRYFKKLEKRYGIRDFHPHKLRHTSASLAITNGADVVSVSERLGHSDSAVTLRMYAHANEESIRRAGQTVRDALAKRL